MKNRKILISTLLLVIFSSGIALAGLVWTNGALSNPDDVFRSPQSIAYSTNGTVFVTGKEANANGQTLIVTRKYNSSGTLVATATNSYFVAVGTTTADYPVGIVLDASGNVYVLGRQYFSSTRAHDMVLIKYNSSLTQQWKKYIYNSGSPTQNYDDKPAKILLDKNNEIYVAGTWSQPSLLGIEEIVIRKFNSAGTVLFTRSIAQVSSKTIEDASDMCVDSSLNLNVVARASDASNLDYVMYARITSTGSLLWKRFCTIPVGYSSIGTPQIECTVAGVFYLTSSVSREVSQSNHFGKIMLAKYEQSGTQISKQYTPELNFYIDATKLRMDAGNNVYLGTDFVAPAGGMNQNHRIYKYNSAGTKVWTYTSPETSFGLTFETFSSSSLFILFVQSSTIQTKLRKLNASNGTTIWTESLTTTIPAGYINASLSTPHALAINSSTSDVAYAGRLFGDDGPPSQAFEYRWQVRKYGATNPRVSDESANVLFSMNAYPVPANDELTLSFSTENNTSPITIVINDISGKEMLRQEYSQVSFNDLKISTSNLPAGIYMLTCFYGEQMIFKKFVVDH